MSDRTIEAVRVAQGAGLPGVWLGGDLSWYSAHECRADQVIRCIPHETILLDHAERDPQGQTALGLARKLDEWEEAGGRNAVEAGWAWRLVAILQGPTPDVHLPVYLETLIARITQIYYDHEIRRALGWEVEPGTLADLANEGAWWTMRQGEDRYSFIAGGFGPGFVTVPALADITDAHEVLEAIHAEVCGAPQA